MCWDQATGCRWTGLTISKQQLAEAAARVEAAGLSDRIELLFCDYRACHCAFDKVCPLAGSCALHLQVLQGCCWTCLALEQLCGRLLTGS